MESKQSYTAEEIGHEFVKQYYNITHPDMVNHFYKSAISRITRDGVENQGAHMTGALRPEMHPNFMQSSHGDCIAQIVSVDSQETFGKAVQLMVIGTLSSKLGIHRNFVQSFTLASPAGRYIILNDIFRYVDVDLKPKLCNTLLSDMNEILEAREMVHTGLGFAGTTAHDDLLSLTKHFSNVSKLPEEFLELWSMPSLTCPQYLRQPSLIPDAEFNLEEGLDSQGKSVTPHQSLAPSKGMAQGGSVWSYSDVLKMGVTGPDAGFGIASRVHSTAAGLVLGKVVSTPSSSPTRAKARKGAILDFEGDQKSVYVGILPDDVSVSILEKELGKFGPIKTGGVQLKISQTGYFYAFIEFKDTASAEAALTASKIFMGGFKSNIRTVRRKSFMRVEE